MSGTPAPAGHSSPRRLLRPCRKGLPLPRAMRGQRDLVTGAPGALPGSAWQPDRRTEGRAARHRYRGGICVPLLLRSCREPAPPGAQRAFCPVCSRARRPDAGRASLFQGPANAAGGDGGRTRPMVSHAAAPLGRVCAPANQGEGLENRDIAGISLQALGRDFGKNRMPLLSFLFFIGIIRTYSSYPRSFPVAAGKERTCLKKERSSLWKSSLSSKNTTPLSGQK